MASKYIYWVDEQGKCGDLGFEPPDYVLEDGWKRGDCVNDVLPDIETLYEQKYLDAQALVQYKIDREDAFPMIAEQLDLLYHDMVADKGTKAGEWFKAVKKVKDDNPKPE
jgi:hypothetical protein